MNARQRRIARRQVRRELQQLARTAGLVGNNGTREAIRKDKRAYGLNLKPFYRLWRRFDQASAWRRDSA